MVAALDRLYKKHMLKRRCPNVGANFSCVSCSFATWETIEHFIFEHPFNILCSSRLHIQRSPNSTRIALIIPSSPNCMRIALSILWSPNCTRIALNEQTSCRRNCDIVTINLSLIGHPPNFRDHKDG